MEESQEEPVHVLEGEGVALHGGSAASDSLFVDFIDPSRLSSPSNASVTGDLQENEASLVLSPPQTTITASDKISMRYPWNLGKLKKLDSTQSQIDQRRVHVEENMERMRCSRSTRDMKIKNRRMEMLRIEQEKQIFEKEAEMKDRRIEQLERQIHGIKLDKRQDGLELDLKDLRFKELEQEQYRDKMNKLHSTYRNRISEQEANLDQLETLHQKTIDDLKSKQAQEVKGIEAERSAAMSQHSANLADLKSSHDAEIKSEESSHKANLQRMKKSHDKETSDNATKIKDMKSAHKAKVEKLEDGWEADIDSKKTSYQDDVDDLKASHTTRLNDIKASHAKTIANLQPSQHKSTIKTGNEAVDNLNALVQAREREIFELKLKLSRANEAGNHGLVTKTKEGSVPPHIKRQNEAAQAPERIVVKLPGAMQYAQTSNNVDNKCESIQAGTGAILWIGESSRTPALADQAPLEPVNDASATPSKRDSIEIDNGTENSHAGSATHRAYPAFSLQQVMDRSEALTGMIAVSVPLRNQGSTISDNKTGMSLLGSGLNPASAVFQPQLPMYGQQAKKKDRRSTRGKMKRINKND